MNITIVSSESVVTFETVKIEANSIAGHVTILEGHVPLLIPLIKDSEVFLDLSDGTRKTITVGQAIMHVTRTSISIIATMFYEKASRSSSNRVTL